MPGNYETYDPATNSLGPPICKICWETSSRQQQDSLNTVWVSSEGRSMIWYLCAGHVAGLKNGGQAEFLKSVPGIVLSPVI